MLALANHLGPCRCRVSEEGLRQRVKCHAPVSWCIEEEVGHVVKLRAHAQVYAELTPKPIAAASLGQVYKGRLKSGETVAVKVQRPYVVETVSIDLFIIRQAPFTVLSAVKRSPGARHWQLCCMDITPWTKQ